MYLHRHQLHKAIPALLCLLAASSLLSAPSIQRATLKTGFSPRVKDQSWTDLRATLVNPDPVSRQVTIRLVPDDSFFAMKKSVFEYQVHLPPSCELDYAAEAVAEGAESFRVELHEKGARVGISDNFLIERVQGGRQRKTIIVISDKDDISLGAVNQMPEYKKNLFQSTISAHYSPSHYSVFSSYDCVVILRPDFKLYSQRQMKAISDYVLSGGRLVFGDPQGSLEAASTSLAPLLPVKPLSIRSSNCCKALKAYFPAFREWSESGGYVDFLDSIPVEGSTLLMSDGDSPLFCSRKFGAGTVFFSALPLTEDAFRDSGIWPDLVKLAYINELENDSPAATIEAMDALTGFSIPSPAEIRNQLLLVLIPMAVIIAVGAFLRKGALAWGVLAIFAAFMTWRIFGIASSRSSQGSQTLLASLDMVFCSPAGAVTKSRYSFFSKRDSTLDISSLGDRSVLSGIPPEAGGFLANMGKMGAGQNASDMSQPAFKSISEPVESKKIDGVANISNLRIKSNASRQFQQLLSSHKAPAYAEASLSYADTGIVFSPGKSSGLEGKIEQAAIILPAGVASLRLENGELSKCGISLDNVPHSVFNALKKENQLQVPILALVWRGKESEYLPKLEDVRGNCLKSLIFPLREDFGSDKIFVPFELTSIISADNSSRMFVGNCRNFTVLSQDDNEYRFKFRVPEQFAFAKAERIAVKLDYVSEGGNIEVTPFLSPTSSLLEDPAANQKKWDKKRNPVQSQPGKIAFKERSGDVFVFSGEDVRDLIDLSGSAIVVLDTRIKKKDLTVGQKLRENQWTVKDFKVSVSGSRKLL